jgi:hypothetical protein
MKFSEFIYVIGMTEHIYVFQSCLFLIITDCHNKSALIIIKCIPFYPLKKLSIFRSFNKKKKANELLRRKHQSILTSQHYLVILKQQFYLIFICLYIVTHEYKCMYSFILYFRLKQYKWYSNHLCLSHPHYIKELLTQM